MGRVRLQPFKRRGRPAFSGSLAEDSDRGHGHGPRQRYAAGPALVTENVPIIPVNTITEPGRLEGPQGNNN
jgi:hypothetical protein